MKVTSWGQFAKLIDCDVRLIYKTLKQDEQNHYQKFEIPKKNGDLRSISAPVGSLKYIQNQLLKYLQEMEYRFFNNKFSYAFHKKRDDEVKGIVKNALKHVNKKVVINVDLEDYFDTFTFSRVKGFFIKNKYFNYSEKVGNLIANILCFEGKLPQGAPTSPIVTNLISQILDSRLIKLAKKYNMVYTRYADDLTFSTNDKKIIENEQLFLKDLELIVVKTNFKINTNKTNIQYYNSRQIVTGIIVNNGVTVPREYVNKTRALAHTLYKNKEFTINGKEGTLNQLEGRFSFIDLVNEENNKLRIRRSLNKLKINHNNLPSSQRDYQRFLFYRHFIINNKPTLIVEGKTDIMYIKAALKNLTHKYPELVKKNLNNYEYNIRFLDHSKKTKHYFGLTSGGDSIKSLLYYFKGANSNGIDYLKFFKKFEKELKIKPIICLFDNEINTKGKPITEIINKSEKIKKELKENYIHKYIMDFPVYLLVVPTNDNKDIEIEDLFDSETLSVEIDGRKFDRSNNPSKNAYGKETFARYVLNNYKTINFDNFIPLLDKIKELIN